MSPLRRGPHEVLNGWMDGWMDGWYLAYHLMSPFLRSKLASVVLPNS